MNPPSPRCIGGGGHPAGVLQQVVLPLFLLNEVVPGIAMDTLTWEALLRQSVDPKPVTICSFSGRDSHSVSPAGSPAIRRPLSLDRAMVVVATAKQVVEPVDPIHDSLVNGMGEDAALEMVSCGVHIH